MKRLSFLLLIPFILLGSCSSNEGRKKTRYHRLEAAQSDVSLSQEEFYANYLDNYHNVNHYDNVKVTIKSNVPFGNPENDYLGLYDLDKLQFLCVVNHNLDFDPQPYFCGYALNSKGYSFYVSHLYEVLMVNQEFFSFLGYHLESPSEYWKCTFTKYSIYADLSVYKYQISFSEDYYVTSVHAVTAEDHTYDYEFDYFNISDCATTKDNVNFETFFTALFAYSNQPIKTNRATIKGNGDTYVTIQSGDNSGETSYEKVSFTAEFYYELNSERPLNEITPVGLSYCGNSYEYQEPTAEIHPSNTQYKKELLDRLHQTINYYHLWNNANLVSLCNPYTVKSGDIWVGFDEANIKYSVSPLKVKIDLLSQYIYQGAIDNYHRISEYTFGNDGLIKKYHYKIYEEWKDKKVVSEDYTLNYSYSLAK